MCKKVFTFCLVCSLLLILSACNLQGKKTGSAERNDVIIAVLTPEGAQVITDEEDLLIFDSTESLAELINFYKTALQDLYVQETGLNDTHKDVWIYSGLYERTNPITIEMRDNGERVRIYIIY